MTLHSAASDQFSLGPVLESKVLPAGLSFFSTGTAVFLNLTDWTYFYGPVILLCIFFCYRVYLYEIFNISSFQHEG